MHFDGQVAKIDQRPVVSAFDKSIGDFTIGHFEIFYITATTIYDFFGGIGCSHVGGLHTSE